MHRQNKYEISLTIKLALDLMTAFSSETGLDRFHVTCDLRGGGGGGVGGTVKKFLPNFKYQLKNKYPPLPKNFTKGTIQLSHMSFTTSVT